jgi:hypothetical protein
MYGNTNTGGFLCGAARAAADWAVRACGGLPPHALRAGRSARAAALPPLALRTGQPARAEDWTSRQAVTQESTTKNHQAVTQGKLWKNELFRKNDTASWTGEISEKTHFFLKKYTATPSAFGRPFKASAPMTGADALKRT